MENNVLVDKLLNKSQEAFIMAIEIYNKPTLKYRVEGFSFFICNAWELLLKAYLIKNKGESNIYYKDNPDRTITLENCINKVMTNDKDPVRRNLMRIIELRNISTHFITEEYEQIYIPLFQSCVVNYINKLLQYFSLDITERLGSNFLALSIKLDPSSPETIHARYPKQIADRLLKTYQNVSQSIDESNDEKYAAKIHHEFYITKKQSEATATFAITQNADEAALIIKSPQDYQKLCPYTASRCIEIINGWIKRDGLNFINPSANVPDNKKHLFNKAHFDIFVKFYDIKNNKEFCYQYTVNKQTSNSYSNKAIEFIYGEIKKDPEHIVQNLKNAMKNNRS